MATSQDILEQGDIFFLYRPAVGEEKPKSLLDVQRFLIVLKPEGREIFRLLVVGRKRLPKADEHERFWGFVDAVAHSTASLEQRLKESEYQTKTRGRRHEQAARPAGEGVYAITLLGGQMHLSYVLELPDHPSEVQRAFGIAAEAGFALSVKNPQAGTPPGLGLSDDQKPDYPERLQEEFHERRFEREDVRLLDYPGAEFILVGATDHPGQAYGLDLPADKVHADVIRELRMAKSRHPMKPLFEGRWQ